MRSTYLKLGVSSTKAARSRFGDIGSKDAQGRCAGMLASRKRDVGEILFDRQIFREIDSSALHEDIWGDESFYTLSAIVVA